MSKKKSDGGENIKVAVRVRPLNSKEKDNGYKDIVSLDLADSQVKVETMCGNPDIWTFDYVFNNSFLQQDIFLQTVLPLVESVMDGFNATIFAYGQSGSGKTFTMTGVLDNPELAGIIPRCFKFIFDKIAEFRKQGESRSYRVMCSFLELYNGKTRDLLSKDALKSLPIRENKDKTFYCEDLTVHEVKFEQDLYLHMEKGTERRQVASTELNSDSSRSHSVFSVMTELTATSEDGHTRVVTSKLNLVDLAGSERQTKTGAQGDTLKEGCNINLSLSALGSVIDTLVKGKGHVPFRSSPLTMLLKDSLGGNSKTVMFANINPSEHNVAETISTLRFADRAKQIKNKPKVQMDPKDAKIAELEDKVKDLKERLSKYEQGENPDAPSEKLEEKIQELEMENEGYQQENQRLTTEMKALEDKYEKVEQDVKKEAEEYKKQCQQLKEKEEQMQYELNLAQQMGGQEGSTELKSIVCEFIVESSKISNDTEAAAVNVDSDTDQVQMCLDNLKALMKAGIGVNKQQLEEEMQKKQAYFNEELAAAKHQAKEETEKLQALNEAAQEALQQSMQRLMKMKNKQEKEKKDKKKLEDKFKADLAEHEERFKHETEVLKKSVADLEEQLKTQAVEASTMKQKLDHFESHHKGSSEAQEAELTSLKDNVEELKETIATKKQALKELKKANSTLTEEKQELEDKYNKEVEELKAVIEDLENGFITPKKSMSFRKDTSEANLADSNEVEGEQAPGKSMSMSHRKRNQSQGPEVQERRQKQEQEYKEALETLVEKAEGNADVKQALEQAASDREEASRLSSELDALKSQFAKQKRQLLEKIAVLNKDAKAKTVEAATAGGLEVSAAAISIGVAMETQGDLGSSVVIDKIEEEPGPSKEEAMREIKESDNIDQLKELATKACEAQEEWKLQAKQAEQELEMLTQTLDRMEESKAKHDDELHATKDEFKEKLAKAEEAAEAFEEANQELQKNADKAEAEAQRLHKRLDETAQLLEESEKALLDVNSEMARLKADMQAVQRESDRYKDESEGLHKETMHLMEKQEQEWHQKEEEYEQELEAARNELTAEAEKMVTIQSECCKAQREVERLKADVDSIAQEKAELHTNYTTVMHRCQEAELQADKAQVHEKRMESKIKELNTKLENNKHILQTQAELLEKKKQKEQSLEEKVMQLEYQVVQIQRESQEHLNSEMDRLTRNNNKKMQQLIEKHQQFTAEQQQEFSDEREKLNKKIQKSQIMVQKVKQRYDEEVVAKDELSAALEEAKAKELRHVRAGGEEKAYDIVDKKDEIFNMMHQAKNARQMRILGGCGVNTGVEDERRKMQEDEARMKAEYEIAKGNHYPGAFDKMRSNGVGGTYPGPSPVSPQSDVAPDCLVCGRPIFRGRTASGDGFVHEDCFHCFVCKQSIGSAKHRLVDGQGVRHTKCKPEKKKGGKKKKKSADPVSVPAGIPYDEDDDDDGVLEYHGN